MFARPEHNLIGETLTLPGARRSFRGLHDARFSEQTDASFPMPLRVVRQAPHLESALRIRLTPLLLMSHPPGILGPDVRVQLCLISTLSSRIARAPGVLGYKLKSSSN